MAREPHRISRPVDAPGPEILYLQLHGLHAIPRGGHADVPLDPDEDAHTIRDLGTLYAVSPAPPAAADSATNAFLAGDRPRGKGKVAAAAPEAAERPPEPKNNPPYPASAGEPVKE